MQAAIINVTNLRLRTYIGFNSDEKTKKQDVVINVEVHYPAELACQYDQVDKALNYKVITKAIIELVEHGHFLLLEKLVADILEVTHQHESVTYAKVRVDKPHALRFADSVSLTLAWQKGSANNTNN